MFPAIPAELPLSDPTAILRYRDGLYAADLLAAAVTEFDFFTRVAEFEPAADAEICAALNIAARPADVLITLSLANGLLERDAGGRLVVSRVAREFLVKGSPFDLGPYFASMAERPVCTDFVSVLRTGRPARWGGYREGDWHRSMGAREFAGQFTAAMDARGIFLAQALAAALGSELASCRRILDVGGGSGVYSAALAARFPDLTCAVLESPPVDEIARDAVRERRLSDRLEVISGDMFKDPLPHGFDAQLFSNVLHDWDVPEVRKLLAASAAALPPDGLIILHEAFLSDAKDGPLPVAEYSCLLMAVTKGRCYGTAELREWLTDAGFDRFTHRPAAGDRSVITARKTSGAT